MRKGVVMQRGNSVLEEVMPPKKIILKNLGDTS